MQPEKNLFDNSNQPLLKVMGGVLLQVGGIVLAIVLPMILLGLWLDKTFDTTPFLTLSMLLVSVPLTIVALSYFLRKTIAKITSAQDEPSGIIKEDESFGKEGEDEASMEKSP